MPEGLPEGSRGRPVRTRSSTGTKAKILDAHVQFELERWSGPGLEQSLTEEVGALFGWLGTVRVADVLLPAQASDGLARAARAQPAELVRTIEQGARIVHEALQRDESTVAQLLPRERFDQLARAVIGMQEIRQTVIAQIMGSSVYTQLVAHELYHGIKNYILKENVLARRVPGASSLLRFGQSAFVVELLVTDFFETHGDQSVDALLTDLGITSEAVARELTQALTPALDKAHDSGYLESRIRSRLDAFYSTYFKAKTSP